jgi:hypothetical protein
MRESKDDSWTKGFSVSFSVKKSDINWSSEFIGSPYGVSEVLGLLVSKLLLLKFWLFSLCLFPFDPFDPLCPL